MLVEIFTVICARYTVQENAKIGKYIVKAKTWEMAARDLHFVYHWPKSYGEMTRENGVQDSVLLIVKTGSSCVSPYKILVTDAQLRPYVNRK
jgi:hypothetical protein